MIGLVIAAQLAFATHSAAAPAQDGRVLVRLAGRNHDISILTTASGVRYTATDKSGRLEVSAATLDDLKQDHPEIYRMIAPTLVDARGVPIILAGL